MNKTNISRFTGGAAVASFLVAAFALAAGCAGTSGSYERTAALGETELRGVLEVTNAPAGVVAVLQSRSGTRAPCRLRAIDPGVADDIRAFAAKGGVVIVTGAPGPETFTVTAVREEGKRRRRPEGDDTTPDEPTDGAWSHITWGSVPAKDK